MSRARNLQLRYMTILLADAQREAKQSYRNLMVGMLLRKERTSYARVTAVTANDQPALT
jgi:hypothetical protein